MARPNSNSGKRAIPRDPFASSRLKIGRAKHHFRDLQAEVTKFRDKKAYEIVIETDADTGYNIHRCRIERPSSDIALILGDCINNLRAALDHMSSWSGRLGRGGQAGLKKLFEQLKESLHGEFGRGNTNSWLLIRELCNSDKHEVDIKIIVSSPGIRLHKAHPKLLLVQNPYWADPQDEIELFRSMGAKEPDCEVLLDVGLPGHPSIHGKSIISLVNHLIENVEFFQNSFDEECLRIGILQ